MVQGPEWLDDRVCVWVCVCVQVPGHQKAVAKQHEDSSQ